MKNSKIYHLYRRAGFGISPKDYKELTDKNLDQCIEALFQYDNKNYLDYFPKKGAQELMNGNIGDRNTIIKELIYEMAFNKKDALINRMVLFWHGHFACKIPYNHRIIQYINVLRKHGLGSFKNLLVEVSKTSAMMHFLNNQHNLLRNPNENYARELLELFTIGRGNYSEADIKAATTSLARWKVNSSDECYEAGFYVNKATLSFMGKTGVFTPEEIIDIILEKKETAAFIASKLYSYFVNEKIDEAHLQELTQVLYRSEYDLEKTMKFLLEADWFYNRKNTNSKIKSPIDLMVNVIQLSGMDLSNFFLNFTLNKLGQIPFAPPNVEGWKKGKSSLTGLTYLHRLNAFYSLSRNIEKDKVTPHKFVPKKFMMKGINKRKIYLDLKDLNAAFGKFKSKENWKDFIELYLPKEENKTQVAQEAQTIASSSSNLEGLRFLLSKIAFQFS